MYRKFIITDDGVLRFGIVYQHRELLKWGERCPYGGGLWEIDAQRGAVLLYGRSFAFGLPDFNNVSSVDWESIGVEPCTLLYMPEWPNGSTLQPICVGL